MKKIIPGILLCLLSLNLMSQDITKQVTIPFGNGKNQITIDEGGGEHWKPLFFDIDQKGNIHIPDFYKARIAVFNFKGSLVQEWPCPEGISPRMNYFALAPNGSYVSFSDYTLYNIKSDGKLNWKHQLGLGFIPQSVYVNQMAIFLVPSGSDQRALVYDYLSNSPLGRIGFMRDKQGIPLIQTPEGKPFTLDLRNMVLIPESPYPEGAFKSQAKAYLLFTDKQGHNYWKAKESGYEDILVFTPQGKLEKTKRIYYMNSETNGNGFWTVIRDELVYKNYFFKDKMIIAAYSLEN